MGRVSHMDESTVVISMKDIVKKFGDFTAVNCVNLSLEKGEMIAFLGGSGCGKTTLLRLMAGLEESNSGELVYLQQEKKYQPKIGMVFQENRLFPWLSVEKNILLSQAAQQNQTVHDLMQLVGLDDAYLNSMPQQLSGGMAQRVAIARALAYQPDLLLMDEPFAALDYFTRITLQEQLLKIEQQTGTAIVFVTHNLDEALAIADRIFVLQKGQQPVFFPVDHTHPRQLEQQSLAELRHKILDILA